MRFAWSMKRSASVILLVSVLAITGCQKNSTINTQTKNAIQKIEQEGPKVIANLKWNDLISKSSVKQILAQCNSLLAIDNFLVKSNWKKECSFKVGTTYPAISSLMLDSTDNIETGSQPLNIQISFISELEYRKFLDAIWEKHRGEYVESKNGVSPVPGLFDSKAYGGSAANDYWRYYKTCTDTTCFIYRITTDDGDIDLTLQKNRVWAYPTRETYLYLYRNSDY